MISVGTAWCSGAKSYERVNAGSLEELKEKLRNAGHATVQLLSVDAMDDAWSYEKSDIPIEELSEADVAWLEERREGFYASRRYLVCRL